MSTNDPTAIAKLWISQMDERLAWLDSQIEDCDNKTLIPMLVALQQRHKRLGEYIKEMQSQIARTMLSADTKSGTVPGWDDTTLHVDAKRSPRRTGIQRDDLIAAVDRAAQSDELRVDTTTGEVLDLADVRLRLTRSAFRLEPRWSELRKLGIDSDEYSTTEWIDTVDIKETKEL